MRTNCPSIKLPPDNEYAPTYTPPIMLHRLAICSALLLPLLALADGPADRKTKLEAGLKQLDEKITALKAKKDAKTAELLPDVEVYFKAIHDALVYQEFFDAKELDPADKILAAGIERADQLAKGEAPWTT